MALSSDERQLLQTTHDSVMGMQAMLGERCPVHAKRIETLELELWGEPGKSNGSSNGLKGHVKSLLQSRKYMRWGLRGLWGVVLLVAGALITWALNG